MTFETEANAFLKGEQQHRVLEMGSRNIRIVYFVGPPSALFHLRSFRKKNVPFAYIKVYTDVFLPFHINLTFLSHFSRLVLKSKALHFFGAYYHFASI